MNLDMNFDGNSFIAGMVLAAVFLKALSFWFLLLVPFIVTSIEIKGMPFAKLTYTSKGWSFIKGRY